MHRNEIHWDNLFNNDLFRQYKSINPVQSWSFDPLFYSKKLFDLNQKYQNYSFVPNSNLQYSTEINGHLTVLCPNTKTAVSFVKSIPYAYYDFITGRIVSDEIPFIEPSVCHFLNIKPSEQENSPFDTNAAQELISFNEDLLTEITANNIEEEDENATDDNIEEEVKNDIADNIEEEVKNEIADNIEEEIKNKTDDNIEEEAKNERIQQQPSVHIQNAQSNQEPANLLSSNNHNKKENDVRRPPSTAFPLPEIYSSQNSSPCPLPKINIPSSPNIHSYITPTAITKHTLIRRQINPTLLDVRRNQQNESKLLTLIRTNSELNNLINDLVNDKSILVQQLKIKNEEIERISNELYKVKEKNRELYNQLHEKQLLLYENNRVQLQLKQKIKVLQDENNLLVNEKSTITYQKVLCYFDTTQPRNISEFGWSLVRELFVNAHKAKNHNQYSEETKQFCWTVSAQSSSAYETLRKALPLPSSGTTHKIVYPDVVETERDLLDTALIPELINKYATKYMIPEESDIDCTLAIDALCVTPMKIMDISRTLKQRDNKTLKAFQTQIAFRSSIVKRQRDVAAQQLNNCQNTKMQQKYEKLISEYDRLLQPSVINETELKDVFIFHLQPHNPNYPCTPIHLYLSQNGSATLTVRELVKQIVFLLQVNKKVHIVDISTDGDVGHSEFYKRALLIMQYLSPALDIDVIVEKINNRECGPLASADLLHFAKTLRTKIQKYHLSLFPYQLSSVVDFPRLLSEGIFGDGREVTDQSQVGKMRDIYPILLFSMKNLNTLIRYRAHAAILYFFPIVLWMEATVNKLYTPRARVFLLKTVFEFFKRVYNIMNSKKPTLENVSMIGKQDNFVTFYTKAGLKRVLPSLAVTIAQIEAYIQTKKSKQELDLALDRLGTHPLENFNGRIRTVANNNDAISTTTHIVARATVLKSLLDLLQVSPTIRGRVNTGGIRMSYCGEFEAPSLNPSDVVDTLFIICNAITQETIRNQTLTEEVIKLNIVELFSFFAEAERQSKEKNTYLNLHIPFGTRNASIQTRNIGYHGSKNEEEKSLFENEKDYFLENMYF